MNNVNHASRASIVAELNSSIIKWINEIPASDEEVLDKRIQVDLEMELLIDLLKEGRDLKRLRDLYGKLSQDLDEEEDEGRA
jgi:hypothetical protein